MTVRLNMPAYSSARRMTSGFWMQWPSSVSATMPALCIEPMGASSSPAMPLVIAPVGKTFTHASALAFSRIHVTTLGLSTEGEVFGMHTTLVKPPAAAALRAGRDGFLRRLSRLAKMDVQIDQARRDHETGGIDDRLVLFHVARRTFEIDFGNLAVGNVDVAHAVDAIRRVDDVAVGDEGGHRSLSGRFAQHDDAV